MLLEVQHCEESFIGTFGKEKKEKFEEVAAGSAGNQLSKRCDNCQKSPGFVKSSDTLPVLFSGNLNC